MSLLRSQPSELSSNKISNAILSLKKENVLTNESKSSNSGKQSNGGLFIYVPLYSDYLKFISSLKANQNKPSFDNFINLIRIVKN